MGIRHLKNAELERQNTKTTKVELHFEATLWKMILDLMQYLPNKDHQHHKGRQQKTWISSLDCQGAQDKQLSQCLLKPRSRWKMLQNYWKFPKSECPDIWIRPPRHKWPKSRSSTEDPVVLLERKLYGHLFGKTVWRKAIWENPIEVRLGKSSKLGMRIRTPYKRIILICACGWHQIGWKETKHWTNVASTIKKLNWENQHLSLIKYFWAALKDNVN